MSADFAETVNHLETQMSEESKPQDPHESHDEDGTIHTDDLTPDATSDPLAEQSVEPQGTDDANLNLESNGSTKVDDGLNLNDPVEADALHLLAAEVESLRLQVEERTSQCMRIAADFDNFRKRTDREKNDLELRVKRDTISELLPVIDSFERARTQIKPQSEAEDNIQKSYQGVYKQLVDCLKRIGVSRMKVEGQPFDPNYHDAVMREPTDQQPEGTVLEELRRGYLLGDLVLRHAMVKVAAPPIESAADAEHADDASGEAS